MVKSNKYTNFRNAFTKLKELDSMFDNSISDEIFRDAIIKRFEFTFDLSWKSLREFLLLQGVEAFSSPRCVFAEGFRAGFIHDDAIWLEIIGAWNSTSHIYSAEIASDIANAIHTRYCFAFEELIELYEKFNV